MNENVLSSAYWRAGIKLAAVILDGHSLPYRQILPSEAASSEAIDAGVAAERVIGGGLTELVLVSAGIRINQHGPKRVLKVQRRDYAFHVEAARSCRTTASRSKEQRGHYVEAKGTHLNHRVRPRPLCGRPAYVVTAIVLLRETLRGGDRSRAA